MEAADPKNPAILQPTSADIPAHAPSSTAGSIERILPTTALVCALLAVWIVRHPFVGLTHDARFYLIQALATLNPDLFAHDVFLRYGSQDRFTVFSPLFALGIRLFGVENAALVLTLVAQAGFIAATIVLARMLMPVRFVWLSLALLFALPAQYGPGQILRIIEDFTTPRLFAEAFVVAGLAAILSRRFWLAALFGSVSMVLHPLMTMGGVVVVLCTSITPWRVRMLALAGGVIAAGSVFAWMGMHGQPLLFDEQWVRLLRNGLSYLWPSEWPLSTWASMLVSATTLVAGVLVLERSHTRSLCSACLIAGVAAVALNFLAGDLLQVALVVQGQPYRWLWVSTFVSILLLPLIMHRLWLRGLFGRVAVLLLAAAWLWSLQSYGIGFAVVALVAAVAAVRGTAPLPERTQKLILLGASGVLALAVIYHVATALLVVEAPDFTEAPEFLRKIRTVSRSGALPLAAFLLIYFAISRTRALASRLAIAAACLTMAALLLPFSVRELSTRWYASDYDAFAEWRALIPSRTEVLWFDAPVSTWLLLQRPSYVSNMQETSGVFSRQGAMVMKHRVDRLESYLSTEPDAAWRDAQLNGVESRQDVIARASNPVPLGPLCASAPDLRFIVTTKDMMAAPLAVAPAKVSPRYSAYRLYRCDRPHG